MIQKKDYFVLIRTMQLKNNSLRSSIATAYLFKTIDFEALLERTL
jgi:hypothetical protein